MYALPSSVQIHFFSCPIDLRKGVDGLRVLVQNAGMDVFSGHVFVFLARKPNRAKMLWWDGGGFVVWYKRLETGCFKPPAQNEHAVVHIDAVALAMLLQGIDVKKVQRPKLWRPRIAS